jgi:hypothetical protein
MMKHTRDTVNESTESQKSKIERQKRRRLARRQNRLAESINVDSRLLKGLELCDVCSGEGELVGTNLARVAFSSGDYLMNEFWHDDKITIIDPEDFVPDGKCDYCGGTGIKFGDPDLTAHEWISISRYNTNGVIIQARILPEVVGQTSSEPIDKMEIERQIRGIRADRNVPIRPRSHGRKYKKK